MLEIALFTIAIAALSLIVQDRLGVPTPITIIVSVVVLSLMRGAFGHQAQRISEEDFDQLIYLMRFSGLSG